MSAVNLFESALVAESRKGEIGRDWLDLLIADTRMEIVPFDGAQAQAARAGWRSFGKGRHPAALNFADCCAYALAKLSGEPLLFKGRDFDLTDVTSYF